MIDRSKLDAAIKWFRESTEGGYCVAGDKCPQCNAEMTARDGLVLLGKYMDTGLEPEEITVEPYVCVFYCNRRCNLLGDWCAEGPGCPYQLTAADCGEYIAVIDELGTANGGKHDTLLEHFDTESGQSDTAGGGNDTV